MTVNKEGKSYYASLEISNVTVEDAGKYRVTAKNELGESNATISLNFDSKFSLWLYIYVDFNKKWSRNFGVFRFIESCARNL